MLFVWIRFIPMVESNALHVHIYVYLCTFIHQMNNNMRSAITGQSGRQLLPQPHHDQSPGVTIDWFYTWLPCIVP